MPSGPTPSSTSTPSMTSLGADRDGAAAVDVAVVGGGIVGLATAYLLLAQRPGLRVVVLEREAEVGRGQSSRNSGVLHAGVYYPPGSAKARWCIAGRRRMEQFCEEHDVPVLRNGKLVVAVRPSELPGLARLAERSRANGVEVHDVDAAQLRELEPNVSALAGLHSPTTAVTDFSLVTRAMAGRITTAGGEVRTSSEVLSITAPANGPVRLVTRSGDVEARAVVACAGLQADRVARASGVALTERIVPFRGSWLRLKPHLAGIVRHSIYPVPVGGLPFLGVHLTPRVDGGLWIGPNAVLALAREGGRPWSADLRDLAASLRFPGLWRLARRYPRVAAGEVWRDLLLRAQLAEVARYVPGIGPGDVERGPWGVRAQLMTPGGDLVEDFRIEQQGRVLHLLNAPSPAATASLAIGEELAGRVGQVLDGR
jgi:(S)-2-hydroxyglutarate dehydrogenase